MRPVGLHPEHAELAFMRVGQRAQEHAVRHAEYGSCTADAEGKREHREQGIHRTAPEDTNRVPTVLRQLFHPLPSPDRARVLLHQVDIAELQQGLTTRLFWRHSAIEVVARFSLDVVADVVVEGVQCPSAARHDVISPARPGGGCARRLRPACPTCWFRSRVASGPSRSVDRTWRAGCSRRCRHRT